MSEVNAIMTQKVYNIAPCNHVRNLEILSNISEAMISCYGPKAGLTMLNTATPTRMTKDGVSILQSIQSNNEIGVVLLDIIKKGSSRNDLRGGDGTTTSALLTIELYRECISAGIKSLPKHTLNKIAHTFDTCSYRNITKERLVDVAAIALNNDREKANIIKQILDEAGDRWDDITITPKLIDDVAEDSIEYEFTNGVVTLAKPIISSKDIIGARALYCGHSIKDPIDIQRVTEIITGWFTDIKRNKTPLIIFTPKIEVMAMETIQNIINAQEKSKGIKIPFDIVEMINMVNFNNKSLSDELALGIGAPVMQLQNIPLLEDGVLIGTVPNEPNNEDAKKYFSSFFAMAPLVDVLLKSDRSIIVTREMHSMEKKKYDDKVAELKKAKKKATGDAAEGIRMRLNVFENNNVLLKIRATTGEAAEFLFDQYKDACLHIDSARKGVIAGGCVGAIKVLASVPTPTDYENKIITVICRVYYKLRELLYRLPTESIPTLVDNEKVDDENYYIKGHNMVTGVHDESVLTSSQIEYDLLRTAYETVDMLLNINQISFKDFYSMKEYTNPDVRYN